MRKIAALGLCIVLSAAFASPALASSVTAEYEGGSVAAPWGGTINNPLSQSDIDPGVFSMRQTYASCTDAFVTLSFPGIVGQVVSNDVVYVNLYLKKDGGLVPVGSGRIDVATRTDSNEENVLASNLPPNTHCNLVAEMTTAGKGYKSYVETAVWTTPKPISKKKAKKSGSSYKWKKAKRVSGYVVEYRTKKYVGKNEYGTKMYKWKYGGKITKKPKVTLKNGEILECIYPFSKHDGSFLIEYGDSMYETKKAMLKDFKYSSDVFYG